MRFMKIVTTFLFLAMYLPSLGQVQDKPAGQEWGFIIKGGLVTPGTVNVDPPGIDLDTDSGFMFGLDVETLVAPKLSMGGFFHHVNISEKSSGESASVNTFGGTLKGRFTQSSGMQIRPGIALGYQLTSGAAFDNVKGLDVAFVLDLAFPTKGGNFVIGEVSFFSQPAGGNNDADVTFAPIVFLAIGYEFGK